MLASHFSRRLFAIAFVGTHIPLLAALLAHMIYSGSFSMGGLLVLLGATALAAGLTLLALAREIRPILHIADALAAFSDRQEVVPIHHQSEDEVGRLAASARWAISTASHLLIEARAKAETDPLTGLANRRALAEYAQGVRGALALIDIDHFKAVNDALGHAAGDTVLQAVGELLQSRVRAGDLVARWGGEEFLILLPDADVEQAAAIVERIRQSVSAASILPGRSITFSAGVGELGEDLDASLKIADELLYEAKKRGRNRVVPFTRIAS